MHLSFPKHFYYYFHYYYFLQKWLLLRAFRQIFRAFLANFEGLFCKFLFSLLLFSIFLFQSFKQLFFYRSNLNFFFPYLDLFFSLSFGIQCCVLFLDANSVLFLLLFGPFYFYFVVFYKIIKVFVYFFKIIKVHIFIKILTKRFFVKNYMNTRIAHA